MPEPNLKCVKSITLHKMGNTFSQKYRQNFYARSRSDISEMFFTFVLENNHSPLPWSSRQINSLYAYNIRYLSRVLTHKAVRRCSSCSFKLILLNCCMQLQLAEFTAPHPGYKPSEMHWMDGNNLQNLDTQTNPLASHQAGHNLRVLMQIDFSLSLCSLLPRLAQTHLHHLF